jgi:glucans biosynthesis protein
VDTALPSGEEFPFFRKFWLVRPTRTATDLMIYALADSPSLTAAYRFVVIPGAQTIVQVDVRIFLRKPVKKLGIAPATSMFLFGEEALARFDDFRPEVHDSDGVLLNLANGEWVWRALVNPNDLMVNAFKADDPKGFGLLQRDRNFDHYQDLETRQDLRPSIWIAPQGSWGRGFLELVEIPTRADYNDNVVMYWVPEDLPPPGEPVSLAYKMLWYTDDATRPPGGRTVATRKHTVVEKGIHRFVVDFEGGKLAQLGTDTVLRAYITVASGETTAEVIEQQAYKNTVTGGWRLAFQVRPLGDDPVELRAFLDLAGEALTETWTYTLVP